MIRTSLAISLGAIAGALSRYYLTLLAFRLLGAGFPFGTFFINLSGCFMMGFCVTLFTGRLIEVSPEWKLLVTTGFLGAYTTFSTYGLDSLNLFKHNTAPLSLMYWLGSAALGVLGVQMGVQMGAGVARWL